MNQKHNHKVKIETFMPSQAKAVAILIRDNILQIHTNDYPQDFIDMLLESFTAEKLIEKSISQHTFVATAEGKILGTAGLANFGDNTQPDYYAVAVFVQTGWHRQGIGNQLMAAIEDKAWRLGAERITVRAALNARGFYQHLGYQDKDANKGPDEHGQYIMEKCNPNYPQK